MKSKSKIISGELLLGEYTISYEGENFKIIEFTHEGRKGIMFISEDLAEILGYFEYNEEDNSIHVQYLYTNGYTIKEKRIEVKFKYNDFE